MKISPQRLAFAQANKPVKAAKPAPLPPADAMGRRPPSEWAQLTPGTSRLVLAVASRHAKWPAGRVVSRETFDAAITAAKRIRLG